MINNDIIELPRTTLTYILRPCQSASGDQWHINVREGLEEHWPT